MENFIVSARKYRPATFNTVVGQPVIVQTLKNAIRTNSLAQAFLFTGPRGIGKTTCARILAKTINCLNLQPDTEPCNECESCRSFNQLASFNIQELDAASNSGVDDIRVLVDQVRIPPQAGKYKVYIIDEVHMLSSNAFNAFLKTLEEPPAYAKFILATTERHKILPTILSRCQIYDFKRITITDIAAHLAWVAGQEGITFEEEAFHVIAQKADGALRDALSIFDQIVSFSGRHISYQDVIRNLNLLDYEYYFSIMEKAASGDYPGALLVLDEIIDKGFDGHHFINGMGDHLRNLLLCKDAAVGKLLESTEALRGRYTLQASAFPIDWLVGAIDLITKADMNYRTVTNKRLHLELLLLQLSGAEKKNSSHEPVTAIPVPKTQSVIPAQPSATLVPVSLPATAVSMAENQTLEIQQVSKPPDSPVAQVTKPQSPPVKDIPAADDVPVVRPASATVTSARAARTGSRRMSLRDLIEIQETAGEDSEDPVQRPDREIQPLRLEEIQELVHQYAKSILAASPAFSAAITANAVSIGDDNTIEITFSNQVAADPDHLKKLGAYIRERVAESWFRIVPVIDDTLVPEKVILSPKDRYMRLTEQHPGFEGFVKKLGLEFES
ncbi:MAG TPA: DNA polymerase III subunit gamma/tau [Bacteroidales bacterium]|nr:DNA polymerase III subunit gamma/tau [Bacteroidales bacterium]HRZ47929.1 DNA polymerase III subunit gamma/tau [Bacteroidales bacterium]